MTRQKKSRKVGQIGIRKQDTRPTETKESRRKKAPKGQKSGSRNSLLLEKNEAVGSVANTGKVNKKVGSKVKIDLTPKPEKIKKAPTVVHHEPAAKLEKAKPTTLPPEQELANIETDALLISLVERVEDGELLTGKDAKYFNRYMARYDELVEILGLDDEETPEGDTREEDHADPFSSLGGEEWDDLMDKGQ